jgi:dTMP kinase
VARGKFITFEGGEGAGKSTQARLLKLSLEQRHKLVRLTREPGGSEGAEQIRKLLVEGEPQRWTALTETLLFLAARVDHVARVIEPSLASGAWVICDRFADSTFVYQGIARGVGVENIRRISDPIFGTFEPDLTIILDIEPHEGLARASARGLPLFDEDDSTTGTIAHQLIESRFERFTIEFHQKLREAFHDIARTEPDRCVVVDGRAAAERVATDVWRVVEERLKP